MALVIGAAGEPGVARRPSTRGTSDRLFFSGMAILAALTVFAGFAPTYYLKGYFDAPALSGTLHVHGLLFSGWIALFVAQTVLVAARRTDIHRRIGVAGAVLAASMVVVGYVTAIDGARRGVAVPGVPPLSFLIVPLGDMLVFAALIGAALYFRRRPDAHKRLMLLGTAALPTAAIARLPFEFIRTGNPLVFYGLTDLFVLACVAYDLFTRRRLHAATLWGGLFLVLSQPARIVLSGTAAWMALAGWLAG